MRPSSPTPDTHARAATAAGAAAAPPMVTSDLVLEPGCIAPRSVPVPGCSPLRMSPPAPQDRRALEALLGHASAPHIAARLADPPTADWLDAVRRHAVGDAPVVRLPDGRTGGAPPTGPANA